MAAVIAAASPSCNPRAALATYPGTGLLGWPVGKAKLGLVQRSYHRTDNINLYSATYTSLYTEHCTVVVSVWLCVAYSVD